MFSRIAHAPVALMARSPVVLVHGLVISSRYMEDLASALAHNFHIFAPDLPGFGESAGAIGRRHRALSLSELAEALYLWLKACRIGKAAFVGNSFGCQVLVELAIRHPEVVERLVLQGPTTDRCARSLPRQLWRNLVNGRCEQPRSTAAIGRIEYAKAGLLRAFATTRELIRDRIEAKLPLVRVPTLVVRGSRDPLVPNDLAPEAEWGFDSALLEDIRSLARQMNWRLVEIRLQEPESLSFVTARAYRDWYRDAGIEPRRLVVDSFLLSDPFTTLWLHALPFWLLFCTEPSASMLQRFLTSEPPFEAIDLMLFSHGTESIGLAPIGRWQGLLKQATREGRFIGVDKERYPRDFATFVPFHQALTRLGPMQTPPPAMTLPFFESALRAHGAAHGVTCIDHTPLARLPD